MKTLDKIDLPCGGQAVFEEESTIGAFRCTTCFAVAGSIGMPQYCKDEFDKVKVWEKLKE